MRAAQGVFRELVQQMGGGGDIELQNALRGPWVAAAVDRPVPVAIDNRGLEPSGRGSRGVQYRPARDYVGIVV
jgi:hypothetical protein